MGGIAGEPISVFASTGWAMVLEKANGRGHHEGLVASYLNVKKDLGDICRRTPVGKFVMYQEREA